MMAVRAADDNASLASGEPLLALAPAAAPPEVAAGEALEERLTVADTDGERVAENDAEAVEDGDGDADNEAEAVGVTLAPPPPPATTVFDGVAETVPLGLFDVDAPAAGDEDIDCDTDADAEDVAAGEGVGDGEGDGEQKDWAATSSAGRQTRCPLADTGASARPSGTFVAESAMLMVAITPPVARTR